MPATVEYQLWRQIRNAFKVNRIMFVPIAPGMEDYHLEQYATMEEALASTLAPTHAHAHALTRPHAPAPTRVFLEPTGTKGMSDIPQGDIVLITGDTDHNNLAFAQEDETYKIKSPQKTALYPSEAAAIALAIRYGQ